ncbi:MAG: GNAT family N-acetyltransferase [Alphaproteobacteria bacterium]|nr:GNAT family N-acetyltransferase [Alphaproteobacteria bacterium]
MSVEISQALGPGDVKEIHQLFVEYAESLDYDLCFQKFDEEVANLPGAYAPPGGRLLLARTGSAVAGSIGLRPLEQRNCEMKRLYVRPQFRAIKAGRRLAEAVIDEARAEGYGKMRLDTLPTMDAAVSLYRALGFKEIAPYYDNPIQGVRYYELDLTSSL